MWWICHRASLAVFLGLAVSVAVGGGAKANTISGLAEVVDGDGLRIGPVAIRIHGINAPELGQSCASRAGGVWKCDEAAADRLTELIGGIPVACEALDQDAYGRVVARCRAEGVDLGETLVREGLVWAFIRYSADYAALEGKPARRSWTPATTPKFPI